MVMPEIYGYARVSTNEQAEDKGALTKQMHRLRSAGATKIYFDIESRTSDDRRGLMGLIEDIASSPEGKIAKFLFIRIDRLTSSSNVFYKLMDALKRKKIEIFALDEPFDISSIGGELTIDVRLAAAKYEVKMLGMRVKKEINFRKSQNKPHWNAPLGYCIIDDTYRLNHQEVVSLLEWKTTFTYARLARFIFDSFLRIGSVNKTVAYLHETFGISYKTMQKKESKKPNVINENDEISLNAIKGVGENSSYKILKWTVSGLRNTLINPIYAGGTPYGKSEVRWGTHDEVIISRDQHERIKEIIKFNRQNRWATEQKYTNPFANILKCSCCGGAYSRQSKKLVKKQNFIRHHYQCAKYRAKACKNGTMISSDNLENQLIEILVTEAKRLSKAGSVFVNDLEPPELLEKKRTLEELEKLPTFPGLEKAKQELKEEISNLIRSITTKTTDYVVSRDLIIEGFSDPLYWQTLNVSDKVVIIRGCVRKIVVDGNKIKSVDFKY
jgi:DNA invertase Pin-like site-specific DNA recombinase